MKIFTPRTLLNLALLGTFAVAPQMAPSAQAAPPNHAPAYGYRAKDNNKKYDKRNNNRYDHDRDNNRDWDHNRDRDNNRDRRTYTGTVSNVRSGNSFDLRANGRTYRIYTSSGLPRGLSRGDEVRVYGQAYGNTELRNASVVIINNERNRNNNRYETFRGIVTNVRSGREFDVRVGNTTYRVYVSSLPRGLSRGDEVRVSGQRSGRNDLRNASVTITRNR